MNVSYSSNKLEKALTEAKVMRREYGEQRSRKLQMRVKELEAVGNLAELQEGPGRWHLLTGNLSGRWAGDVSGNFRIIITPLGEGTAVEITSVRVEEITDYH